MATTKLRHGTNFVITLVSLILILAVVNYLSYRHLHVARWDLTENKDYTISPVTKDILQNLENLVNVKVYLSDELPAVLLTFERQLKDLLAEYENYGRGKLRVEYIAPGDDQETRRDLMFQGIEPQPVGVYKRDSTSQQLVYNSIAVEFEEKREVIPSLLEQIGGRGIGLIGDFEYLMTSKIFKVQRTGRDVVGWFTNAPDLKLDESFRTLRETVRKEWDVRDVRLDPPSRIANDVSVLAVVSPRDLTEPQLYEIDQYIMRGGKVIALLDGFEQQTRGKAIESFTPLKTNFTELLASYGLKTNQELVLDRYCARAPMGFVIAPYQFWVNIVPRGFNKENPAVSRLRMLTLPWTMNFDAVSSLPAGVEMVPLARTSQDSTVRRGARINPNPQAEAPPDQTGPRQRRVVVAALKGTLPSHFPEGTPMPMDEGTTTPNPRRTPEDQRKYQSPADTKIVAVGTSHFLRDDYLTMLQRTLQAPNRANNVAFFLNSVEWLALGRGLGEIRTREAVARPIKSVVAEVKDPEREISESQRGAYKIFGTLTMPVVVIVAGILYNTIRRRRRRAVADRLLGR